MTCEAFATVILQCTPKRTVKAHRLPATEALCGPSSQGAWSPAKPPCSSPRAAPRSDSSSSPAYCCTLQRHANKVKQSIAWHHKFGPLSCSNALTIHVPEAAQLI